MGVAETRKRGKSRGSNSTSSQQRKEAGQSVEETVAAGGSPGEWAGDVKGRGREANSGILKFSRLNKGRSLNPGNYGGQVRLREWT